MKAARLRIWGIGELEKELKRVSSVRTSLRRMPSGSMYSYGSNAFSKLRFGVVERLRFGMASFGCVGLLVEWLRCEETFWESGRRVCDGLNCGRVLLIIDRHCLHVYGVLMLCCGPQWRGEGCSTMEGSFIESYRCQDSCRRRPIWSPTSFTLDKFNMIHQIHECTKLLDLCWISFQDKQIPTSLD